jgi:metal transporter CNNM
MTRIEDVFGVLLTDTLDFDLLRRICASGYTRIPVFANEQRHEVVGLLSTKDLILLDPEDGLSAEVLLAHCGRQVFTVWFDHPVNKMFADFKHRHTHLAFVQRVNDDDEGRDPFYELQGIVTLEDVLEELIQAEIVDESDVILDNVTKKPVQVRQGEAARRTAWHNMLDPKQLVNKNLTPVELEAVSSFLAANVGAFAMDLIAPMALQELLGRAAVRIVEDDDDPAVSLKPRASRHRGAGTTPLYRRGQQCGHCTVVLQGRLHIVCGEEGFESDRGPWTVLGAQSLQDEKYVADFSASPTERSRVLQISHADYQVGVEHHRALLDMNAPIPSARHGVITSSLPVGADGSHLQQRQEQQLETSAVAIAACSQQAAGPRSSEQGRHSPGVTSGAARATGPQRKKCQLSPVATRPSAAKVVKVASAPSPAPGTDTSDSDLNV